MSSNALLGTKKRLFRIWVGVVTTGFFVLFYFVGLDYVLGQGIPGELIHFLQKVNFPFKEILVEGLPGYSQAQLAALDTAEQQLISRGLFSLTGADMTDARTFFLSYFQPPAQSPSGPDKVSGKAPPQENPSPVPPTPAPGGVSPGAGPGNIPSGSGSVPAHPSGYTVVIDPGHGGKDPGAQVPYKVDANSDIRPDKDKLDEKAITLAVSLRLKDILRSRGIHVIMTRTTDTYVGLAERAAISNKSGANIFVCVHCNWVSNPAVTGVLGTYFENGVAPYTNHVGDTINPMAVKNWPLSKDLAADVADSVAAGTGQSVFGLQAQPYEVLRLNDLPSTLVELGFMTNPDTASAMETAKWQTEAATGIANGIAAYFADHAAGKGSGSNR
ncbi:N-acetylmuramoyl-L-alanine amidase [Acididesulfobacillus acetoxydans]|uniref:N-acetylmuramoyl-L-alanine amidase n=1 Tax=Acididesulfobacillus acetoxydans TaxID=1561005 RepID=A0A8S0X6A7_9FIRM|nr:N-acetylmuramoyl-L-alanine amidase [Acididesulfobacillus acetoxydans]CAA7602370.1 N-acetylmuramoyl-L-alanine amidase [Acididesulfobacillus acetoxydans]CEJ08395.1 N-acetylmuramoyl-L-alanine amidase [Acididesulfobacillus acetoxydans]